MIDLMRIIEKEFVLWHVNMILFTILITLSNDCLRLKRAFIFGEWTMKIWKLLQNNRLCYEIIAFIRFSTPETSRSVVLDLKLAWLLLGGLTFADFQERMSSLLCCKVLIDEWCQEIMARFYHQFLIPYDFSSIVWWWCSFGVCDLLLVLACGSEYRNSAFEFGMVQKCANIIFLSERFSDLLRLLLSYNWAYLNNDCCMFGLTVLCEFEDFSWWLEEECFAPHSHSWWLSESAPRS